MKDDIKAIAKELHLAMVNKDYLDEEQAASYCCVSYRHFRSKAQTVGICPGIFLGKIVYRKTDLQRAIEREAFGKWQPHMSIMVPGISNGRKTARGRKNGSADATSLPKPKPNIEQK